MVFKVCLSFAILIMFIFVSNASVTASQREKQIDAMSDHVVSTAADILWSSWQTVLQHSDLTNMHKCYMSQ